MIPPNLLRFLLGCVITSAISLTLIAFFYSSARSAPPARQPEAAPPIGFVGADGVTTVAWRAERLTRREEDPHSSAAAACGGTTAFPRIIHQTWKRRELPTMFKGWMRSCHYRNPTMEHYFYTDSSLRLLVDEHFPGFSARWRRLRGITRGDVGRLLVLWIYGGVYQDMDYECLRPYEGLLQEAEAQGKDFIVGEEHLLHVYLLEHLNDEARPFVSNAWIAATPRHPLIGEFLNQTLQALGNATAAKTCQKDPVACTGPRPLTALVHKALDTEDSFRAAEGRESSCDKRPPLSSVMVTDFDVLYGEYAAYNGFMAGYCVDDVRTFDDILPRPRRSFANQTWAWQGCAMLAPAQYDEETYVSNRSVAVHHWMCSSCRSDTQALLRRGVSFDVGRDMPWVVLM
ncbi:unnamed protein product [Vitrella brassicaformis CCMP3155]|uniref:Alpha 1,4-glycosyltransferase domain-containing protein n=1 Tax=Vitrella brassicaformis (strain CCMP3155) TaxID=1169540 RepID=A0A0G4GHZ0_VITBC|nr:unnamed protein product [Vitrella brassicaformis CCMP3155]|eukprot:CEM29344.1 unnamed protein product [Vitrella brassicaformis CCMP3155]